jgi:hypothetical protein
MMTPSCFWQAPSKPGGPHSHSSAGMGLELNPEWTLVPCWSESSSSHRVSAPLNDISGVYIKTPLLVDYSLINSIKIIN